MGGRCFKAKEVSRTSKLNRNTLAHKKGSVIHAPVPTGELLCSSRRQANAKRGTARYCVAAAIR